MPALNNNANGHPLSVLILSIAVYPFLSLSIIHPPQLNSNFSCSQILVVLILNNSLYIMFLHYLSSKYRITQQTSCVLIVPATCTCTCIFVTVPPMCYLRVGATIGWCGWYYNSVPSTMYQCKVDVDMLNAIKSM